jgi:hypothetical protein
MSDERSGFEIARLIFTGLGGLAAALGVGGRIGAAFLAQRALEAEAKVLERVGTLVMPKELVEVKLADIERRVGVLERWRERLNGGGKPR